MYSESLSRVGAEFTTKRLARNMSLLVLISSTGLASLSIVSLIGVAGLEDPGVKDARSKGWSSKLSSSELFSYSATKLGSFFSSPPALLEVLASSSCFSFSSTPLSAPFSGDGDRGMYAPVEIRCRRYL